MKTLLQLFLLFAKIGVCTFGGGYAMLPILHRELVEKRGWTTEEELADYFAIGQCTPGVIAVNTATFIGFKKKGVLGGISATLGVVFPSLVIIMLIATFLNMFSQYEIVQHAFNGIRIAVCAIVAVVIWKLARKSIIDWVTVGIAVLAFSALFFFKISSIFVVIGAAFIGITARIIQRNLKKKKGGEK